MFVHPLLINSMMTNQSSYCHSNYYRLLLGSPLSHGLDVSLTTREAANKLPLVG